MDLWGWADKEVKSVGGSVADRLLAPPDASTVHSAAPIAPTAPAPQKDEGLLGSILHGIGDYGRGVQQEGLSGLLDPTGAVDRQRAQRELAARFNVVAPGTAGAGDQNTVTQEEFQKIARQYSDIRMDRSDLHVSTDGMDPDKAAAFKQGTMNDIASMMQTNSGRALIGDLQTGRNADGSHRQTTIGAMSDKEFADKGGVGGGKFDSDGTHKSGYVRYRPGEVSLPGNADARSDVALMHELTHADASIHNNFATGDVTAADGATAADIKGKVSRSEYQAAGMGTFAGTPFNENAYRRDRAAIGKSGSGVRDDQGHGDVGMGERKTYLYDNSGAAGPGGQMGSGGDHHHHDEEG